MNASVIKLGKFHGDEKGRSDLLNEDFEKITGLIEQTEIINPARKIIFQYGDLNGGDLEAALSFAEALSELNNTEAEAYGAIQSAGLVTFLACKKRRGDRNCRFLLHSISLRLENITLSTVDKKMAELSKRIKLDYILLIDFITRQTKGKFSRSRLVQIFDDPNAHWLDAEEAKKAGIIHEII